jgi:hypothetical protein
MAIDIDHKLHVISTTGDPQIDPPLTIRSIGQDVVLETNLIVLGTASIGGVAWPTVNEISDPATVGKFLVVTEGPGIGLADAPSGGSSAVADLTDVSLEAFFPLASGDVLTYEAGTGWINRSANDLIEIPEPPAVALDALSDVSIGGMFTPSAGDVLTYEDGTGWFNRPLTDLLPPGGGGGGASVLDDLTDVSIGTPLSLQSGDVLTYEAGTGWFNRPLADLLPPPAEIPEPEVAVADLTDVVLGSPFTLTSGDSLVFESGMGWINRPVQSLIGTGSEGQVLTTVAGNIAWADAPSGGGGGGGVSADQAIVYSIIFG